MPLEFQTVLLQPSMPSKLQSKKPPFPLEFQDATHGIVVWIFFGISKYEEDALNSVPFTQVFHCSKGLQWPIAFHCNCNGQFPLFPPEYKFSINLSGHVVDLVRSFT